MGDVAEDVFNSVGSEAPLDGAGSLPPLDGNPGEGFKMPTMEEFLSMLDHMEGLSDEEKEQLRAEVTQNSLRRRLQAGLSDYLVFIVMLAIILGVLAFFGYKLYLSLTEKERKREEKLKAKQEKSKKKK
ncbi:uncharacterized protein LOC118466966 isoform X2 [Anopheles albimanus]|uniref:uncharacterized protein LOC118466966 isoform X2 n=1 Tax=Anopheles albimanus TaxID=7167 RepID=UPI0016422264|nr:uncharacterized protein LOC118466966 isoform X2 [Anopheles albimanus]